MATATIEHGTEGKPGATNPEGAEATTGKRNRKRKVGAIEKKAWGVRDEEGKLLEKLKGTKAPEGFNEFQHKPLVLSDFEVKADFFDYRADIWEKHARELRQMAIDERAGVSGMTVRAKTKKALSLKAQYEALMSQLKDANVDLDAAFGVQGNGEAAPAA